MRADSVIMLLAGGVIGPLTEMLIGGLAAEATDIRVCTLAAGCVAGMVVMAITSDGAALVS